MPRALGQIDARKTQAILDAAAEVLAAKGLSASIEEIARRARVSKQTIYNHYGSKADLVRELTERRLVEIVAPLDRAVDEDSVETTLALYAASILQAILSPISVQLNRMAVASAVELPEMAHTIYAAGAHTAAIRLATYLKTRAANDLRISDTMAASETFVAMVIGRSQYRLLLGLPAGFEPKDIQFRAKEAARRFIAAYSIPVDTAEAG